MNTRKTEEKWIIKLMIVPMTFFVMAFLCSCKQSPPLAYEYGKSIQGNTQEIQGYTQSINERMGSIEASLEAIQEEIIKDEPIDLPEGSPIQEEEPAPVTDFDVWVITEGENPERYRYEAIIEGLINSDDEVSRGWLDEGTKKLLKLIKGNTISKDYLEKNSYSLYKSLDEKIGSSTHCIRDFFYVDEYGYPVSSGIFYFFETVDQLEKEKFAGKDLVFMSNGNVIGWDFDEAEVAAALGISEELIDIFEHAAADAGFHVNFD